MSERNISAEQKIPEGAVTGVPFKAVPCTCWAWVKDGEPEWHWPDCAKLQSPPSSNLRSLLIEARTFVGKSRCSVGHSVDEVLDRAKPGPRHCLYCEQQAALHEKLMLAVSQETERLQVETPRDPAACSHTFARTCTKCGKQSEGPSEKTSRDPAILDRKVTVCSECLCACCWQGAFYCDNYRTAKVVEKTVRELKALGPKESPDYWFKSPDSGKVDQQALEEYRAAVTREAALPGCMLPDGGDPCEAFEAHGRCEHSSGTTPGNSQQIGD